MSCSSFVMNTSSIPNQGIYRKCPKRPYIFTATFYKYKAKFGGMNVSDTEKLRALEDENNRPKRMLADAMLDNAALKDLATKNY